MTVDDNTGLPPLPPPKYGHLNYQRGLGASSTQPTQKKQRTDKQESKETAKQQAISSQNTPPKGKTLLGLDIETNEQVLVTNASRRQGTYIIGSTGTGKTGLMENMLLQNIRQNEGVCLLDPHGDLTRNVIARMPEDRLKDVIYLNIKNEDTPFGLNLFTCQNPKSLVEMQYSVDQVMHIFEKIFEVSRTTPRMAQYLRNCAYTIIANPGYTMAEIPMLLTDKKFRQQLVANVTDPQVLVFWKNYEGIRDPDKRAAEATSTLNKLDEFLQPLTRNIVGQARSSIDFYEAMQQQKIILVTLDVRMDNVTSLIGSTIVALLLNAAYERGNIEQMKRKHVSIFADEFQRFATEDFATLLTEACKFAYATTIAHQSRDQLSTQNRATSLQAANLIIFRVSGPDAKELASNFDSTPLPFQVKKSISQNPIDNLLNGTHPNAEVRELTQTFLLPLINKTKRENQNVRIRNGVEKPEFLTIYSQYSYLGEQLTCSFQDLQLGIFELRLLLVAVMEQRIQLGSPEFVEQIQKLLYSWRAVIGWADIVFGYERKPSVAPGQQSKEALNEFAMLLVADCLTKKTVWSNATQAARNKFVFIYIKDIWGDNTDHKQWTEGAADAISLFISRLYRLCDLLAQEPIEVAYGPQDGAHMTYADMMNLVANKLANLQQFTACVKVGTDKGRVEHTIRTLTPERGVGRKELEQRIATITTDNLEKGYLRSRNEVEKEILARQNIPPFANEGDFSPRREF